MQSKGLTDIAVRNARARDRAYKLSDGRGLCLLVQPNGSKWWRLRYKRGGKEKMLSMGTYPDTSLADARKRRDEARQKIEAGTDPGAQGRLTEGAPERTFEDEGTAHRSAERGRLRLFKTIDEKRR